MRLIFKVLSIAVKNKTIAERGASDMSQEAFSFVMYIIHACAQKWNRTPTDTYQYLEETGCIDNFLIPNYDILHTQGTNYVIANVEQYVQARSVQA